MRMLLVVIACCAACGTAARSPAPPAVRDPLQVRCRTQIDACIALSERTPAPAAPALQASCDRGDADACFALALAYADGRGIAQDVALALALYERACRGGHPIACGMAGNARLTGQGTPIDFAAAFQPTRVAARLAISMPASGAQRSRLAAVSRAIREKRSGTRAAAPCAALSITYTKDAPDMPSITLSPAASVTSAHLYQAYPGFEKSVGNGKALFSLSVKATKKKSQSFPIKEAGGGWTLSTTVPAGDLPADVYDTFPVEYQTPDGKQATFGVTGGPVTIKRQ